MKKFSMAAAAAIVAGAMFVPSASAAMSDEQFDVAVAIVKALKCEDLQGAKEEMQKKGIKTRNDAYDAMMKDYNNSSADDPNNMSKEQARKLAAVTADRYAECKVVSFPVTERVTTFFGSKGQNSSTSSIGGFSS